MYFRRLLRDYVGLFLRRLAKEFNVGLTKRLNGRFLIKNFLGLLAPKSGLIKVDGIELKVLQGSRSLFNNECVIIIEATLGDKNPRFNTLVEYLSAYGFKVFDIVDPLYRPRDWHLWQVDLVFVKKESQLWNNFSYLD